MSYELTGRLIEIYETQQISDRFRKREFVIEKQETGSGGYEFVETIKFQLVQDRCEALDQIEKGTEVKVHFNIKGRRWEKEGKVNYFNNLEAWRIEAAEDAVQAPPPDLAGGSMMDSPDGPEPPDDLPF